MTGPAQDLPLDPDLDADESANGAPRPIHLGPGALLLVFTGGTIGTAAREALSLALPPPGAIPYTVFGINVVGALLLGALLEGLVGRGPDRSGRRLRLLLGTGVLGGFTTYSTLATDAAHLIGTGSIGTGSISTGSIGAGAAYGVGTVLVGALATWIGIALAAAARRRTSPAQNQSAR